MLFSCVEGRGWPQNGVEGREIVVSARDRATRSGCLLTRSPSATLRAPWSTRIPPGQPADPGVPGIGNSQNVRSQPGTSEYTGDFENFPGLPRYFSVLPLVLLDRFPRDPSAAIVIETGSTYLGARRAFRPEGPRPQGGQPRSGWRAEPARGRATPRPQRRDAGGGRRGGRGDPRFAKASRLRQREDG